MFYKNIIEPKVDFQGVCGYVSLPAIFSLLFKDKKYLFWSCLSFELFGLSLVVDHAAAKYASRHFQLSDASPWLSRNMLRMLPGCHYVPRCSSFFFEVMLIALPGFVFRAAANICRLMLGVITSGEIGVDGQWQCPAVGGF